MRNALIACCLAFATAASAATTTLVTSLSVQEAGEGMCRVTIKSNTPLARHKVIPFENPPKMVIDITGAVNRLKRQIKLKNDIVKRVRTSQFSMRPQKVRIVLDLYEKVEYEVEDGKNLTFLLKTAKAIAAAKADSVRAVVLASASAESLRTADSLRQVAVAESLAQAGGGMGAMLASFTEGGLVLPLAGGGGALLLIIIIVLVVRSARKRKKAEAEFEEMLSKEGGDANAPARPGNWFDEDEGGEENGENAGEKTEEDAKLDMLETELAKVKEQADKLTEIGGFEVSVVDNEPDEAAAAEDTVPGVDDDGETVENILPELDDEPADDADSPGLDEILAAAEKPESAPEPDGDDFNIDDFQKAFSGAGEDAGVSAPKTPEVGEDNFDLDATIAQLKEKMKSPPPPAPAPEPEADVPQSIDDVLDTGGAAPAEPSLDDILDGIPTTPAAADIPSEPELPAEPPVQPDEPAPAAETAVPAVDHEETARLKETMARYDAQENRIVEQLDAFQAKMEGYKNLLAEREARLAKMADLNDKISRDMEDIQARLDASLQQLDKMQSAPPAEPVAFDVETSGSAGTQTDATSAFDVTIDDAVDFTADTVTAAPAPEPDAPSAEADTAPVDVDDVFGALDDLDSAPSAPADGADSDLPDFGASDIPAAPAAPEAPVAPPVDDDEPKFKKVFRLTDEGLDVTSVAQQLGIGRGQVELFLKLREKGKMS